MQINEDLMEKSNELMNDNHKEFMMIPIDSIIIKERIRTRTDTESDDFRRLVGSIRQRGVLEPIIVVSSGDSYELLCGERRFRASQFLGLTSIPARIFDESITEYDRIELELIENFFRSDLNPISEARGYQRYFHERLDMNIDDAINNLIKFGWKDDRIKEEAMEVISTIVKFSGKSSKTIQKLLKLLKLPSPIQNAIEKGKINLSLGEVFVSHLTHPMLMTLFHECMWKKPMSKQALIKKFEQGRVKNGQSLYKTISERLKKIGKEIKRDSDRINTEEAENLQNDLNGLNKLINNMLETGEFMAKR